MSGLYLAMLLLLLFKLQDCVSIISHQNSRPCATNKIAPRPPYRNEAQSRTLAEFADLLFGTGLPISTGGYGCNTVLVGPASNNNQLNNHNNYYYRPGINNDENQDEVKPVNEDSNENAIRPTWKPNGVVGGNDGSIVGLVQDLTKFTTESSTSARNTFRRNRSGILEPFFDLLFR